MSRTPHAVVECWDVEPRLTTTAGSTAGDIMTTPVITVAPDTSVGEVAETLRRHRVSGVPVVDAAGTVLSLVSEYDLLAKTGGPRQRRHGHPCSASGGRAKATRCIAATSSPRSSPTRP
jgi:CBS domain-containing protein